MSETSHEASEAAERPQSTAAFRERLLSDRHLFTKRMLEAGSWVLDNERIVALETLSVISARSGLTGSTFVRLAQAMGFDGFSDMQRLFRAPLKAAYPTSLSERISHSRGKEVVDDPGDLVSLGRSFCRANAASLAHLEEVMDQMPLDATVERILGARTVHVVGFDRSFPVASYLAYSLRRANVQTIQITGLGATVDEDAAVMVPGDIMIAASFPPYANRTVEICAAAGTAGYPLIAITDTAASPITLKAAEMLLVQDAELQGFRSLTAVMSLVQTITMGVAYRRRAEGAFDLTTINA